MCLITFAYKVHPDYKLLLIANRDEFYNRPTELARPWPEHPHIIGGRDLQAGGSWLAVSSYGRFAAVTNFREGIPQQAPASRGQLVTDFLLCDHSPQLWAKQLKPRFSQFNGFNLLLGTPDYLYYVSNRSTFATTLSAGFYSLSNHLLDTPWPKAEYSKSQLQRYLENGKVTARELVEVVARKTPFADSALPETGLSLEMERTLSAPFIQTENYGTRCTTVLSWLNDKPGKPGRIDFYEQSFHSNGTKGACREFTIESKGPL